MGKFVQLDLAVIEVPALAMLLKSNDLNEIERRQYAPHRLGVGNGHLDLLAGFQPAVAPPAFVRDRRGTRLPAQRPTLTNTQRFISHDQ